MNVELDKPIPDEHRPDKHRPSMNDPVDQDEDLEHAPIGAIVITTLLLVVIVVMWFGIYILNLVRS